MIDRAHRATVVGLLVAGAVIVGFVVAAGASPGGVSRAGAGSPPDVPGSVLQTGAPAPDYDEIVVQIRVFPNATASWQVEFRYELEDPAAEEAFDRLEENVTNPPGEFVGLLRESAIAPTEAATGREMSLMAAGVNTNRSTPAGRYGIVRYHFLWTNFAARPSGDRLVVGDALGSYQLQANDTMAVEWTDGLRMKSVTPDPVEDRQGFVEWTGPMRFRTAGPRIELAVTGGGLIGLPVLPVAVVVGLALALGAGWYGSTRWRGTGEASEAEEASPELMEELLSDEERVLRLLEARAGRMKQQDLLEEVEWSRTKASDVVNEMHEAGQIEVYRLGRENVLALPGEIDV